MAPNKKQDKKGKEKPVIVSVDHGVVGTSLFNGIITEEFNPELQGREGRRIFDKMRKSDGGISGMLRSVSAPLLSAKYFIKEFDKSEEAKKHADFIRYAFFERLRGGYTSFFREALTYLAFGFSIFEKIYAIDKKGMVVFDRFAPRIQSSLYSWEIAGKKWHDGHPAGITQLPPGTTDDMVKDRDNLPTIPWEKLIVFTNEREGNNFEGTSILRTAYKHWYYKDLLYKIQGISAERFGVGIPVGTHPKGISEAAKSNLEELLQNIRANEQAYIRLEDGTTIDLMTIKGDPKASSIADSISHHDRKIYDSILAGFLNLTSGEGGSNALSKDHSQFFSRALRGYADYHTEVMNCCVRELIDLNFSNVEGYPTLEMENFGEIDVEKQITAISNAKEKGLVTWTSEDEMATREMLGLPDKTMEEIEEEKEAKKIEQEKIAGQINDKKGEKDDEGKGVEEEEEEEEEEEDSKKKEKKPEVRKQSELPKRPKPRERAFNKRITEFSKFLEENYKEHLKYLEAAEDKYRRVLELIYKSADTERVDGVLVLAGTKNNAGIQKKALKAIDDITKQLEAKIVDSPLQEKLFAKTKQMAIAAFADLERKYAEYDDDEYLEIDGARFNSFVAGHVSNVKGVLFNDPRRVKENIILNFGSKVSLNLALEQAGKLKFNRNVFRLSTVTHAHSAYSSVIYDAAVDRGYTFFKVVVPPAKIKDLNPSGRTASVLFGIYTAAQLNKKINEATDGQNANAVSGLGIGHNTEEFYYPISSEELEEEESIAAEQKKNFARQ